MVSLVNRFILGLVDVNVELGIVLVDEPLIEGDKLPGYLDNFIYSQRARNCAVGRDLDTAIFPDLPKVGLFHDPRISVFIFQFAKQSIYFLLLGGPVVFLYEV